MRRLLTWLLVSLGIAALVRRLRRKTDEPATWTPVPADPADELRQKLSESRTASADEPEPEPAPPEESVEERRAKVHEEGRSTLDEMRATDE